MTTYKYKSFEAITDFTKVHNAIHRLYSRLPDFKSEHAQLYTYLISMHNDAYGYAFPDTWDIALALNCGERSIPDMKRVLVKYGLVEIKRHSTFGNDIYFLRAPITSEAELYAAYPEARVHYEKKKAALGLRKGAGAERLIAIKAQEEAVTSAVLTPEQQRLANWF